MIHDEVVQAVHQLTAGDPNKGVSYAAIARQVDASSDSHRRNRIYDLVVDTVKELIQKGTLRYIRSPIAGHPAKISIPYQQCLPEPRRHNLFEREYARSL